MIGTKSLAKYIKIHVYIKSEGEGIDSVAFLVIQKSLSNSKTQLKQPIWPESWRKEEAVGRAVGIQTPMAGQRGEVSKLVSVLILNQSAHLNRLT